MAYSQKVIEHYENPKNVGSFAKDEKYIGTAIVGAPVCGDVMKLQIKVDPETGKVIDAKFKTFGCMSAIAASSELTTRVVGTELGSIKNIKNTDIADELLLPPEKIHCSILAEEAITKAVEDYESKWGSKSSLAQKNFEA